MSEITRAPQLQCDNCGHVVEYSASTPLSGLANYHRPNDWGSCKMVGGKAPDNYGQFNRLDFTDLCPTCADAALDAAAKALAERRGEDGA